MAKMYFIEPDKIVSSGAISFSDTGSSTTELPGLCFKDNAGTKYAIQTTSTIVNNLTSTCTNWPLSAAQGNALSTKFSNYLLLSGGTVSGNLTFKSTSKVNNYDIISSSNVYNGLNSTSTIIALSAYQGKVLNDKFASYLPLSGGTVTGALYTTAAESALCAPNDNKYIRINGGASSGDGSYIILTGKGLSGWTGDFQIGAYNGSSHNYLRGYSAGNLTWTGNKVLTVSDTVGYRFRHDFRLYNSDTEWCLGTIYTNSSTKITSVSALCTALNSLGYTSQTNFCPTSGVSSNAASFSAGIYTSGGSLYTMNCWQNAWQVLSWSYCSDHVTALVGVSYA